MTESVLQQSAMKCLIDHFGYVEAERFISLILKEPFDYTKWQEHLYEDLTVEQLSQKAMAHRRSEKEPL
jgi:hypothetical protein